ncbi:kinase-like protein [Wolfiporia cocos MD-104 SS10]|uniref:Casein kinase II subunit alpha n=1 Tax=Wolfiporia cocos (strain MD-104) TaxID=742152 RepID=A0A2H3JQZ9_WOLCO|nr:kinase-like protein [Wolfiporia cocos MD-104 SS10]
MARVYADVNATLGPGWYDYESLKIEWNVPDRYEIIRRIGGGKYSEVFEGIDLSNEEECVIKVLKPVAKKKIKREIKILRNIAGGPNVISLLDVIYDQNSLSNSLVMEFVLNSDWRDIYRIMSEVEIKYYIFQLLKALDFVHSRGIMHRDVKPANIMFDRERRKLKLIDWGLAEFYHPGTEYHPRVGSRYFKSPELLVAYKLYDYSLDLWCVGCILASLIFRREFFFRGRDNDDQLVKIVKALGSECFERYLAKYDLTLRSDNPEFLNSYVKQPWTRFICTDARHLATPDVLELIDKLLRYDHQERLTAAEAIGHAYFNVVRLQTPSNPAECFSDSGFYSA